jgi:hypothetical protein
MEMKTLVLLIVLIVVMFTCEHSNSEKREAEAKASLEKTIAAGSQSSMEYAYFQGQLDAVNGRVRIALNADNTYFWKESPWDDKRTPIYNPTYEDSQFNPK